MHSASVIRAGHFSAYKTLATFTNVEELNDFERKVLYHFDHIFTKKMRQAFRFIKEFACKILGVAYFSWKFAQKQPQMEGVSRTTFYRATELFEQLGILKKVRTESNEHHGLKDHNLYVLQPIDLDHPNHKNQNETSIETSDMKHREEPENPDFSKEKPPCSGSDNKILDNKISIEIKDKNIVTENTVPEVVDIYHFDKSFAPLHIPKFFRDMIMTNSAYDVEKFWYKSLDGLKAGGIKSIDLSDPEIQQIIQSAWYAYHKARAKAKSVRDPLVIGNHYDYYFGILRNMTRAFLESWEDEIRSDFGKLREDQSSLSSEGEPIRHRVINLAENGNDFYDSLAGFHDSYSEEDKKRLDDHYSRGWVDPDDHPGSW